MNPSNEAPVGFPVWDAVTSLPPGEPYVSTMREGETPTCLSLRRGGLLGQQPAVTTFSMLPTLAAADPRFLTRTALLAFVDGLRGERAAGDLVDEIMRLSMTSGTPARLTVDGEEIAAVGYTLAEYCCVVRSADPRFGLAVAASRVVVPHVAPVDWATEAPGGR